MKRVLEKAVLGLELKDNRISTEAEFWGSSISTKVTEFPTLLVRKSLGIVFEELVQVLKIMGPTSHLRLHST